MWGLWLLDRTWLSLARWEHRHRKQRMVFSFLNSPQFDPRARDAGERWIIVMGVFVPGLREGRVCVLQMGKCSQNRLSVRVLPEFIEMEVPEITLLPAMIVWNLEAVSVELEYFCSQNMHCLELGKGMKERLWGLFPLWCSDVQFASHHFISFH